MRRNMAFVSMVTVPVALTPVFFGWISDTWNLRASFWTSIVIMGIAVAMVALLLPKKPRPRGGPGGLDLEEETV